MDRHALICSDPASRPDQFQHFAPEVMTRPSTCISSLNYLIRFSHRLQLEVITRNSGELGGSWGLWRAYFADSMVGVFRDVQQKA
jgi:hypothetical protein